MKKVFLALISSLLLFSCGNGIKKLDDEYLPIANKGKYYQYIIKIKGRKAVGRTFKVNIHPNNSGLKWKANDNPFSIPPIITKDYNNITIKGNPNVTGDVYIDFYWTTYGTNMNTGKKFQKRYILKVEE